MKDTEFYNEESIRYSDKRYPKVPQSYTQFFFLRRLALTKAYIRNIVSKEHTPLSLLELGCADGVVVRELAHDFPEAFSSLVGIDISPGMVEEAKKQNILPNAEFLLRQEYADRSPVDVINETGVINYAGFDTDVAFAYQNLKEKGRYVLSVAGTGSLRNMLKHENGFADFRTYAEYEKLLKEKFEVISAVGCGVFIPLIWKLPAVARAIQSVAEAIMGRLAPGLCHEKLYLLRKK